MKRVFVLILTVCLLAAGMQLANASCPPVYCPPSGGGSSSPGKVSPGAGKVMVPIVPAADSSGGAADSSSGATPMPPSLGGVGIVPTVGDFGGLGGAGGTGGSGSDVPRPDFDIRSAQINQWLGGMGSGPFTLRDKYYWGMSKDEILALAWDEGLTDKPIVDGNQIVFTNILVDGYYTAHMFFILDNSGRLEQIFYEFSPTLKAMRLQADELYDDLLPILRYAYGASDGTLQRASTVWTLRDTKIGLIVRDSSATGGEQQCYIAFQRVGA